MAAKKAVPAKKAASGKIEPERKRAYLSQTDIPSLSLSEALKVPKALLDNYAGQPTAPFKVAKALNVEPKGSQLRALTGAAISYGLITGGAQATEVGMTDLAKRILKPLSEGDDAKARREAFLIPRITGEFLKKYNGSPIPRDDIAQNVLEEMGVPADRCAAVLQSILTGAGALGLVEEIKGKKYADLSGTGTPTAAVVEEHNDTQEETAEQNGHAHASEATSAIPLRPAPVISSLAADTRKRRVFITHGKDKGLVEPIRKLLKFGELDAVVAVERQTVSKPVPDKVMSDMRSCGAAIIHVEAEQVVQDEAGEDIVILNPNVLIEIGAAMAFYGRRFVLLVKDGIALPSNLQGLYEVRYSGSTLDGDAAIRLLEAINDIKNNPLPGE
jgi:predicted nucleotide-binding protein